MLIRRSRPHARGGEPQAPPESVPPDSVVPTHVGVNRTVGDVQASPRGRPHARGGGPIRVNSLGHGTVVVPTHVGVNRINGRGHRQRPRRPHARGGGPHDIGVVPHWSDVVPTHVGVDQIACTFRPRSAASSPRTWGWTDPEGQPRTDRPTSSPRTWGWTANSIWRMPSSGRRPHARGGGPMVPPTYTTGNDVVPTHVGVDRGVVSSHRIRSSRPHARGGGPVFLLARSAMTKSSPRTWGWTDERVLQQLASAGRPHARGGGPFITPLSFDDASVVPTHVGVDRPYWRRRPWPRQSSPRTWGWTAAIAPSLRHSLRRPHARGGGPVIAGSRTCPSFVVPTHVGVDRSRATCGC